MLTRIIKSLSSEVLGIIGGEAVHKLRGLVTYMWVSRSTSRGNNNDRLRSRIIIPRTVSLSVTERGKKNDTFNCRWMEVTASIL